MRKQFQYIFKQNTVGSIYFAPVDTEGTAINLEEVDDIYFSIKGSSLDTTEVVGYQNSSDPNNVFKNGDTEVGVLMTTSDLSSLTVGTYVAEIQLQVNGVWRYSNTFIFKVVPKIGTPS